MITLQRRACVATTPLIRFGGIGLLNRIVLINGWWRWCPGPKMLPYFVIELRYQFFQVLYEGTATGKPTRNIPNHHNLETRWRHSWALIL